MTLLKRALLFGGFLGLGLGLPQNSFAITGCHNGLLNGTYNAQITSLNFQNLLTAVNGGNPAGTPSTLNPGGFGNNAASFSGRTPGMGRYYFDGNGNIVGRMATANGAGVNAAIGSYAVAADCNATMSLKTGETFNAVVANTGAQVLFIQSDATGEGAVGTLQRSSNACLASQDSSQAFAFSFNGAQVATSGSTASPAFSQYSAVGSVTLQGDGGFRLREWVFANGHMQAIDATGTFSESSDCSIQLTFAPNTNSSLGGTSGAATATAGFRGLEVDKFSGLVTLQPDGSTTLTGVFVAQ